jgi:hypothetical protein
MTVACQVYGLLRQLFYELVCYGSRSAGTASGRITTGLAEKMNNNSRSTKRIGRIKEYYDYL